MELLLAELSVFLIWLEVLRTEISDVIYFAISDVIAFSFVEPLYALAHLPNSKLGRGLLWAEVHA